MACTAKFSLRSLLIPCSLRHGGFFGRSPPDRVFWRTRFSAHQGAAATHFSNSTETPDIPVRRQNHAKPRRSNFLLALATSHLLHRVGFPDACPATLLGLLAQEELCDITCDALRASLIQMHGIVEELQRSRNPYLEIDTPKASL